jgi:hypothetical protein
MHSHTLAYIHTHSHIYIYAGVEKFCPAPRSLSLFLSLSLSLSSLAVPSDVAAWLAHPAKRAARSFFAGWGHADGRGREREAEEVGKAAAGTETGGAGEVRRSIGQGGERGSFEARVAADQKRMAAGKFGGGRRNGRAGAWFMERVRDDEKRVHGGQRGGMGGAPESGGRSQGGRGVGDGSDGNGHGNVGSAAKNIPGGGVAWSTHGPGLRSGWGSKKEGAASRVRRKAQLLDACFGGLHNNGGDGAACAELRERGGVEGDYVRKGGYDLLKEAAKRRRLLNGRVDPKEGLDW